MKFPDDYIIHFLILCCFVAPIVAQEMRERRKAKRDKNEKH